MTAARLARAELKRGWPGDATVITWLIQPDTDSRASERIATLAASGELLIASAHPVGSPLLDIADVICCHARPDCTLTPDQALARYPGCAVAAAPEGRHRYRVATRTRQRFTVTLAGLAMDDAAGTALSACFVYCWLATLSHAELLAGRTNRTGENGRHPAGVPVPSHQVPAVSAPDRA